ncbi:hypothetical protein Q7P36_008156 [Cladosporium allicinum]
MAEPQPSTIHEGAETPPAPAGGAAASEAAALSSLDNKTISGSDSAPKKEVDMKALNDAMKALGSGDGNKKAATAGNVKKEEPAKLIKVEAADVSLLAEHLDVSRTKATELLRAHDANAVKAMKAWVTASA